MFQVGPVELVMYLLFSMILVAPLWIICKRMGVPEFLALLSFLPGGAIVVLWILAFWPARKTA